MYGFLHSAFEMQLHSLAAKKEARDVKIVKGRHLTSPDLEALGEEPSAVEVSGLPQSMATEYKVMAVAFWLQRRYLVWSRLFHSDRPGVCHLATDGARAGG